MLSFLSPAYEGSTRRLSSVTNPENRTKWFAHCADDSCNARPTRWATGLLIESLAQRLRLTRTRRTCCGDRAKKRKVGGLADRQADIKHRATR